MNILYLCKYKAINNYIFKFNVNLLSAHVILVKFLLKNLRMQLTTFG